MDPLLGLTLTSVGGILAIGGLLLYLLNYYKLEDLEDRQLTITDIDSAREMTHSIDRNIRFAKYIEIVMRIGFLMAIVGMVILAITAITD